MFPPGSRRGGSGAIRRTGALTHPHVSNISNDSSSSDNNNRSDTKSELQNDLLREFHAAGIYSYAEGLGIIQNGTIASLDGMNVDQKNPETGKEGVYPSTTSNGMAGDGYAGALVSRPGQSVSMDGGSIGSPSRGSDLAMVTPAPNMALVKLQHLDVQGDDFESPKFLGTKKKKRGPRVIGGEKGGRGLRHFSMKVCEKVESKGRTTYNEVADELVAEFGNPNSALVSPDQQQYDEKNIRRRVYDALNVLMAMDIISKDKKEIQWKGLPSTSLNDIEQLKAEGMGVRNRIAKKTAYSQELEDQIIGLQNLVQRNEYVYGSGNSPSGGVALPFILVQTRPHATVEVEISEDMQLVHFDFNSTPFELHDDAYVLKAMRFCERPLTLGTDVASHDSFGNEAGLGENSSVISNLYQSSIPSHSSRTTVGSYTMSSADGKSCTPPPVPGILKARVKHENFM